MFGDKVSLYAEDRCLQLLSSKGDGRFVFSQVSEKNFTDYFKLLVDFFIADYFPAVSSLYSQWAALPYSAS